MFTSLADASGVTPLPLLSRWGHRMRRVKGIGPAREWTYRDAPMSTPRKRARMWLPVFIEALCVAFAEACVAALGWLLRKLWRRLKRRKRDDE